MKAYWIDTPNKQIVEVEYDEDFHTISREWLKCGTFTVVEVDNGDAIFVDDEGLINDNPHGYFRYRGYNSPLVGYGLVLGTNDEGESTAPITSLEDIQAKVLFPTKPLDIDPELLKPKIYELDKNLRLKLSDEEDLRRVHETLETPLKNMFEEDEDLDPDFDPAPMFFLVDDRTIHVLNAGEEFHQDKHGAFRKVGEFARALQKKHPERRIMAAMLCAGWTLDAETNERVGENVLIIIETASEKCLMAFYKVTRRMNQPPLLERESLDIGEEPGFGAMANFFNRKLKPMEHPQRERDS